MSGGGGFGAGEHGSAPFGEDSGGEVLQNLGFELAAGDGTPRFWSVVSFASVFGIAGYASVTETTDTDPTPLSFEGFEVGWRHNELFVSALVSGTNATVAGYSAALYIVPQPHEDFERGWNHNENFVSIGAPLSIGALYTQGTNFEDFESQWGFSEFYFYDDPFNGHGGVDIGIASGFPDVFGWGGFSYTDWAALILAGRSVTNSYAGVNADAVETFNRTRADQQFTAVASTDTITTVAAHGLSVGHRVVFYSTVGNLPQPIQAGYPYFVKSTASSTTLTLALTNGGTTIDITQDTVSGAVLMMSSPYEFWKDFTTTI